MKQLTLFPACESPTLTRWRAAHPEHSAPVGGVIPSGPRLEAARAIGRKLLAAAVAGAVPRGSWRVEIELGKRWVCDCPRVRLLRATRMLPARAVIPGLPVVYLEPK